MGAMYRTTATIRTTAEMAVSADSAEHAEALVRNGQGAAVTSTHELLGLSGTRRETDAESRG
jgi:hypothetical protein